MVHSNMTQLLEQVYQGRVAKEQTRMEEYGGKKMAVSVLPSGLKFASVAQHDLEMDTTLYQRDRGELDWDARSMTSTAMLDDGASISNQKGAFYAARPPGFDRYMSHGTSRSNGSDIELARMDSNDQLPLLNPGMNRTRSDIPSRPGSRLAEVDLGSGNMAGVGGGGGRMTPPQGMYRQPAHAGSERSLPPSYTHQAPSMSRQGSAYAESTQGGESNFAGRGAFRNQQR